MFETFLIGGLSVVICLAFFWYPKETIGLFVVIVIGAFIYDSMQKSERETNTKNLIQEYQSKYGCIQGDCANGEGIYVYEDETRYEGSFINSKKNGQGLLLWKDGQGYMGTFLDGDFDGYGLYEFADGDTYEGVFKQTKFHGQGVYKYKSGGSYQGTWVNGTRDGQGVITYSDGSRRSALYENGKDYCATNYNIKVFKCPNP